MRPWGSPAPEPPVRPSSPRAWSNAQANSHFSRGEIASRAPAAVPDSSQLSRNESAPASRRGLAFVQLRVVTGGGSERAPVATGSLSALMRRDQIELRQTGRGDGVSVLAVRESGATLRPPPWPRRSLANFSLLAAAFASSASSSPRTGSLELPAPLSQCVPLRKLPPSYARLPAVAPPSDAPPRGGEDAEDAELRCARDRAEEA